MAIDRLVGIQVTDETGYQAYRDHMMPILERFGGRFVLDVRVSEVLRAPSGDTFNRLFILRFPDEEALDQFFEHPEYTAVKAKYFVPSVGAVSRLLGYTVEP